MKNNILLLVMSFLFFTTHTQDQKLSNEQHFCFDQTTFYAQFLSGVNFLQTNITDGNKSTFKPGYIIDLLLGCNCPYGIHLEAEYAFRRNSIKTIDFFIGGCSQGGHYQNSSLMANLLWDLPVCSLKCISSYIGGGLGCDFQQIRSSNSRFIFCQKWKSLSWQVMAGLTYRIFCNTDMILEYKFHQANYRFYNHTIGIGVVCNY